MRMHRMLPMTRAAIAFSAAAMIVNAAPAADFDVEFGSTTCVSLAVGVTDTFSFDAAAGDVIWARMAEIEASLEPRTALYDPDGFLVMTGSANNATAELLDVTLTKTGTYTIEAFDLGGDDGGDYCFHVQRVSAPGQATALPEGPVLCSTLEIGTIDAFTFDGTAGDLIWLRGQEGVPALELRMRLYGPDGTLVVVASTDNFAFDLLDFVLPQTGQFTALVYDDFGNDGGDYCLHFVNISDSVDAAALVEGPVQCAALDEATEIDVYTFAATAGDLLWLRGQETEASLELRFRLYGPSDTLVATGASNNVNVDVLDLEIAESGVYTLLVYDDFTNDFGGYCLHLVDVIDSVDSVGLAEGPVQCAALDGIADIDVYTFDASAGELLWIRGQESAAALELRFRLYGPDGTFLTAGATNNFNVDILDFTVPVSGPYTLLVFDDFTDDGGGYCLHLVDINDSVDAVPLTEGPVQCSGLDETVDIDVYTFDGIAGDTIWLRIQETTSALELRCRLYGPDDVFVGGGSANNFSFDYLDFVMAESGTYTLLVFDDFTDDVGDYCLHLVNISDPIDATDLAEGPVQCADLDGTADIDVYTFDGDEDHFIWLRGQEVTAALELRFRLYGPDDVFVTAGSTNNFNVDILDLALALPGTYTLLVFDDFADESGEYCLHLLDLTDPVDGMPVDLGPVHCASFDSTTQIDAWTFPGVAGASARIRAVELAPLLELRLRLYDPDGVLLGEGLANNVQVSLIPADLPVTGTYTLAVFDDFADEVGPYRVEVELCEDAPCPPFCDADFDHDRDVDFQDLLSILSQWGTCACCDEDINASQDVEFGDLLSVLATWGPCPE